MKDYIFQNHEEKTINKKGSFQSSGLHSLQPGVYRFVTKYRIIENPNNNINLVEIMIANWKIPKVFRGVNIPGKLGDVKDDNLKTAQIDLKLDKTTDLEFRITLLDVGVIAVNEIKVYERKENVPDNPMVLFILEDRQDPSGGIHQGFSAIAAYLKEHGINSHALITSTSEDNFIEAKLKSYRYKYIGFSVVSGNEQPIMERIDRIKNIYPDITVIVGGPRVTITRTQMLEENKNIDIGVIGEGEQTCYEIISGRNLADIHGIAYRSNGRVVQNEDRKFFESVLNLPIPLRDIYFKDEWQIHSLLTSRGCPYKCHFCSSSRIWGSKIRFRPIEQIDQELKWIYDNSDHSLLVVINDDMFNLKKDRTLDLMHILKKYPFTYYARGCRADKIESEITKEMKAAGITGCGIGIESADDESLRLMQKNETIEEIEKGINHLRANGILVSGQFMIGNIGDTLETVKKSIEFAKKLDSAYFYSACLYPGTPLTEYVLSNNYLLEKPYIVTSDSPSTGIYFETPIFPLEDRIKAIKLADDAGFIYRFIGGKNGR